MKILIITNNDVGLYKFRRELLEELLKEHEVAISLPNGPFVEPMIQMGCRFIETPFNRRGKNPFADLKLFFTYVDLLRTERPDVVFTYTIKPNVYGGLSCRMLGIPHFANMTGLGDGLESDGLLQKILVFLHRIAFKKSKVVFCQNAAILGFLKKHRIADKQCCIIPGSGVNLERFPFCEYPAATEPLRLIYVGRMLEAKGMVELFEAADMIRKKYPHVGLSAVGDIEADFKDTLTRINVNQQIEILPAMEDVRPMMRMCHALINPAHYEGMSNVMLEAAAIGRPLIATAVPGHVEILEEGVNGTLCRPYDAGSLAEAMERFIAAPYEEKSQMGLASRKKVEAQFDRKIVVSAYQEELQKMTRKDW